MWSYGQETEVLLSSIKGYQEPVSNRLKSLGGAA